MNLAGKRVLLTRAAEDCERWAEALRAHGAEPVVFSCVDVEPMAAASLREPLQALRDRDWWWFTSRRGVEAVSGLGGGWPTLRFAAVGAATASALEEAGASADFVGSGAGAAALAREWLAASPGGDRGSVAILAADRAGTEADELLDQAGVPVRRLAVYHTRPRELVGERTRLEVDVVLLASPSAVEGLRASASVPAGVSMVSIGPRTSRAVQAAGWRLAAEAARPTLEGMLESLR